MHLLRQPVNLPASVTEDDSLCDGDRFVEIAQSIQLPFLLFDCNVELLDAFPGKLIPLDEDPNWVPHELLCHLQHIHGYDWREKNDLGVLREEVEDLIDLVLETVGQRLVGLIETEDLDVVSLKGPVVDHIIDTTRSADNDVNTLFQLLNFRYFSVSYYGICSLSRTTVSLVTRTHSI